MRVPVASAVPRVAVSTTGVSVATGVVVTVKVAVVEPAGTVTEAGTLATAVLALLRVTEMPPVGAGSLRVTVPVEVRLPLTLLGVERDASHGRRRHGENGRLAAAVEGAGEGDAGDGADDMGGDGEGGRGRACRNGHGRNGARDRAVVADEGDEDAAGGRGIADGDGSGGGHDRP